MNKMQEQVYEFQKTFRQPHPSFPTMITDERKLLRTSLLIEEMNEYLRANNIIDIADALGDMLYILFGTAVEHGLDMQPIIDIIQDSNMSKLDDNGMPIINEFGKIVKSHNFIPPEPRIEKEVIRQIW